MYDLRVWLVLLIGGDDSPSNVTSGDKHAQGMLGL
jgi:hypothetical protein